MLTQSVNPTSLLGKIELLVSASLHDMVNQALKAKSPEVLTEQIRRLGLVEEEIGETYAIVESDRRIAQDKAVSLAHDIEEKKARATTLKRDNNMALASLQVKAYMGKQASLEKTNLSIVDMEKTLATLTQAKEVVKLNIEQFTDAKETVERTLQIAHTQNKTVNALEDVGQLLSGEGVQGILDFAERAKIKSDVRLEQVMAKHSGLLTAENDPDVAAELANL
jgi:hypothetical protein